MDDAARVRRGQTLGDRGANVHRIAPGHCPLRQPGPKRVPLEQLHDGHGLVVHDRELVNRHDAGVGERCDRPRLGLEAPPHLGIGGDVRRHDFDGDVAIEPWVARAIHFAHAAGPDRSDDLVLSEARAGRECRHGRFPSLCEIPLGKLLTAEGAEDAEQTEGSLCVLRELYGEKLLQREARHYAGP